MGSERETRNPLTGPDLLKGGRRRWQPEAVWTLAAFAAIAAFVALFYLRTYDGLVTRNAVDIAQIARNISEGHGFTTRFVRPFNVALYEDAEVYYPEMNHAPAYPYAVAALFKVKGPSEQVVIWMSMLFALLAVVATYALGRLLFTWKAGLLGAAVFASSLPVLAVATSGEEWSLAVLLLTLLLCVVALHHRIAQTARVLPCGAYAALSAALVAALYMTNHVLVFLVIPVAVYFAVTGSRRRLQLAVLMGVFLLSICPWGVRNGVLTGCPVLGATAWDVMSHTNVLPGDVLYRSADSANLAVARAIMFPLERFPSFAEKSMRGSAEAAGAAAGMLGWLGVPFALVSMLYQFRSPSANAVRGVVYGAFPLAVACFALYSVDSRAVIVFAPIAAVLASAYLLLLLDAKRLHPFFVRSIVTGFVLLTAYPALVGAAWKEDKRPIEGAATANLLFSNASFNSQVAARTPVYTDVPWQIAWRTTGVGVWLPRSDADIANLDANNLPMNVIVLTPECSNYPQDEIWRLLYRVRLWREYVADPQEGLKQILGAAPILAEKVKEPEKAIERLSRRFLVFDSIKGFVTLKQVQDPLGPEDIQILVRKEERPR